MRQTYIIWLFFALSTLFLQYRGYSQNVDFESLSVEDGLSQNTVRCLLQDSKGLMWLGTEYGLNCYDGYSFVAYKNVIGDSSTLNDNRITALHEDRRGNLWVGTENGGLHRFIREKKAFERYMHNPLDDGSLSDNRITGLQSTATGVLWIATQSGGLNKLDIENGKFLHFLYDPIDHSSIGDNHLYTLTKATENKLWVGHAKGFDLLDAVSNTFVRHHLPLEDKGVKAIRMGFDSTMWIGTHQGLFSQKNNSQTWTLHPPEDGKNKPVSDIYLAKDSTLWVGTSDGLLRLRKSFGTFELFQHYAADRNSLSSSNVKCITEDASGIIWIGTYGGGVNKYLPSRQFFGHFRHIAGHENTLHNNYVTAICTDNQQQVWIGTSSGIDLFNSAKNRIAHYAAGNTGTTISNPYVTALAFDDHTGMVWVGTHKGLNMLDPISKKVTRFVADPNRANSLSSDHVYSLLVDKERNALWVGTSNGLNKVDLENFGFQRFMSEPDNPIGLGGSIITTIIKSNDGLLWIGTYDAGFFKFNPITEIFRNYKDAKKERAIGTNSVMSLYEAPNGELWIGTFDGGLNRFNPSKNLVSIYTEEDGLSNNQVYGILPDAQGGLWCSTNDKIAYFNPNSESFKTYDIKDGLQGNEFNPHASAVGNNGELFFGGPNGFNVFNPELIKDNEYAPNVILTGFELFNSPVPISSQGPLTSAIDEMELLELSHLHHTFSFEFASLSYQLPERNQYAYMLEGLDLDWQYIGRRRKAYFTGVAPGTYIFKVKATNSDGVWNQKATSIKIVIEAPFWRTWWFLALVLAVLSGIAYWLYTSYQRRIAQKMGQLQRMVEKARSETHTKTLAMQQQGQKLRGVQGELSKHKDLLLENEQLLRRQDRDLKENLAYASQIQESLLIPEADVHQHLPESFVTYMPKQQVGGDFYWLSNTTEYFTDAGDIKTRDYQKTVIAVGDCAGKGISSALLSMVAVQMLHEIVNLQGIKSAKKILDVLNHNFGKTLNHKQGNIFYGLDLALCSIDWNNKTIEFAGAMRPIIYIQRGELHVIKGENYPIGVEVNAEDAPQQGFAKYEIDFSVPVTVYMLTDGFEDQLGGSEHRKYMFRRIKELLLAIYDLPMETQKLHIEREFLEWKGTEMQIDDLCILGFRLPRKSPKSYPM